jgi:hypothetical protein
VTHFGRNIPAHLDTALRKRDRVCQVPGCGITWGLERDHIVGVEDGGPTELANLAMLCHRHHLLKTNKYWRLIGSPGNWEWVNIRPEQDTVAEGDYYDVARPGEPTAGLARPVLRPIEPLEPLEREAGAGDPSHEFFTQGTFTCAKADTMVVLRLTPALLASLRRTGNHPSPRGHPTATQSTATQSTATQSTATHSTSGHSTSGHSTSGHSTSGHSTGGDATISLSTAGHPTPGHPTPGHPTPGHSTAAHSTGAHSTATHSTGGDATLRHPTLGHSTGGHSTGGHSTGGHSTGPQWAGGHWTEGHGSIEVGELLTDAPDDLLAALDANAFDTLAITAAYALAAGELPVHHGDPDRMLIAQARMEGLTLVTVDERLAEYDVELLTIHLLRVGAPRRVGEPPECPALGARSTRGISRRTQLERRREHT